MGNFVTYAEQTLETFDERAFSSVDSLILSWLSYFHYPDETGVRSWDGVPLTELFRAEYFEQLFHGNWDPSGSRQLLSAMAASPRFRDLRLMGYTERRDDEAEKQFAALSFGLPDGSLYVAYRGTDSSFTGWKEDFNMAFQYPVPAQEEAALYLAEAAKHSSGTVRVGGHSKGGNGMSWGSATLLRRFLPPPHCPSESRSVNPETGNFCCRDPYRYTSVYSIFFAVTVY